MLLEEEEGLQQMVDGAEIKVGCRQSRLTPHLPQGESVIGPCA